MTSTRSPEITQERRDDVAARLYALLPADIRAEDAAQGRALEAFIAVLAQGSAEIDRELDRFHDALFVETAPEDALTELGALVAAEPMNPLPAGAGWNARAFIANTIWYRRGKGTARVLAALAADITGEGAQAVEVFRRLVRLQHLADLRGDRPGLASLVDGETRARVGTAQDALPRLSDLRSIARAGGRGFVPSVGLHLLRPVVPVFAAPDTRGLDRDALSAEDVAALPPMQPWPVGEPPTERAGYFQLAPMPGEPIRLFNPDRRSDGDEATSGSVRPERMPDRLRRLPLHRETDALRRAYAKGEGGAPVAGQWCDPLNPAFTLFIRAKGQATFRQIPAREVLIANFDEAPAKRPAPERAYDWVRPGETVASTGAAPISAAFDPVTGRLVLPAGVEADEVRVAYATGIGRPIGAGPHERNAPDVPFELVDGAGRTHFIRIVDGSRASEPEPGKAVRRVETLQQALADWSAHGDRPGAVGVIVLARSDRDARTANLTIKTHPGTELTLVAAQWRPQVARPGVPVEANRHGYLVRRERMFTLAAAIQVEPSRAPGTAPSDAEEIGTLTFDGIAFTGGITTAPHSVSALALRHCSIRAKPTRAALNVRPGQPISVTIEDSLIDNVRVWSSSKYGDARGSRLMLRRCIVGGTPEMSLHLKAPQADVTICDATILGHVEVGTLDATNTIFAGSLKVIRHQVGCMRYSHSATSQALPKRFRCQPDLALQAARSEGRVSAAQAEAIAMGLVPVFYDTDLCEPMVGVLHPLTDLGIRAGGEGDTEMGAFAPTGTPIRRANLTRALDSYLPFGAEAEIFDDSLSSSAMYWRHRP